MVTENILTNGGEYVQIDDNNIDAVIYSKDDLTLNGAGTLTVNAAAGHGVVSKDDPALTGGTYNITAEKHGLFGKDSVRISNGTYTIKSGKDGIQSENTDDAEKGYIYIAGGSFEIKTGDDGIHSDADVLIKDGNFNISYCYEGIEGLNITIDDGSFDITAHDDGFNAAGGADSSGFGGGRPGMDRFNSLSDRSPSTEERSPLYRTATALNPMEC